MLLLSFSKNFQPMLLTVDARSFCSKLSLNAMIKNTMVESHGSTLVVFEPSIFPLTVQIQHSPNTISNCMFKNLCVLLLNTSFTVASSKNIHLEDLL